MKILFALIVFLVALLLARLPIDSGVEIKELVNFSTSTPAPSPTPIPYYDDEEDYELGDDIDEQALMLIFTRPIASLTILRSKPWDESEPNLDVALVPGDIVQIYHNPLGESEWVEVWVPRYHVTGYIRMSTIGEVK